MTSWPTGDGEMAGRIRAHDWAATPLGPLAGWSPALRTVIDVLLAHGFPMVLLWGAELVQVYNDGYRQILGDRHPRGLGQPTFACWPETFDVAGPSVARARAGEAVTLVDARFPIARTGTAHAGTARAGAIDARWFTVAFSPVLADEAPGSVLVTPMETTARVLADAARDAALAALRVGEERQDFLLRLSDALRPLADPSEIQGAATRLLAEHLGVSRAVYAEFAVEGGREIVTIEREHRAPDAVSLVGRHPADRFGPDVHELRAGRRVAVPDAEAEPSTEALEVWRPLGVRARLGIPLVKGGRLVAGFGVHDAAPHPWSGAEIELVAETAERTWAAVERARAEAALRASEERQAFLLKLSDALRPLGDPAAAQGVAARMLGVELGVDRCYYAEFDWPRDVLHIAQEYVGSASFSVVGEHPISAFQDLLAHSHKGEPLVCDDIATHPVFSGEVAAYRERGTDGFILIPLIKQGVMEACMCVTMSVPRAWSAAEVEMVREVGDRTWEAAQRIRAEGATRESEERFQQFAASSSDALWIRDAAALTMEYVSPAIATIYGVPPEEILGDPKRWAALIVPEDRDVALGHLERARGGEAVVHEFRILRPSDGAFRWIRDTDFPLLDERGRVQRIGGIAEDVTEARQAAEHQRVLLHELQHRVRNILAMIRAVADQTGDTAGSVGDYRDLLEGRLQALARVQVLLTRAANAGVDLATLVRVEIEAQAAHAGQCTLSGPEIVLSPKAAEVLTLAVHELATNALKHGAFSHAAGRLAVSWRVFYALDEPWLRLDWVESGAPAPLAPPRRDGFGTALVRQRIPYELGGRGEVAVEPGGARCGLEFPLRRGGSILETGAVTLSTTIAGGSLDMAGEADLTGCRVLVVEDDFFLAKDTARAVQKAGGTVVGPVSGAAQALDLIAAAAPTCALVDINLGSGAEFGLAEALQDRGVPFAFVTGYDDVMIPPRFDGVERVRKPTDFRQIVRAAARLCGV